MALSATWAKALKDPGRYADGGGLHLYISKAGGKSWVQRITIDRRRRDIGLGAFPSVGLAQAREKAADNRTAVAEGRDPLAEKHSPAMPTFTEAARAVHAANKPRWRNDRHSASWLQTLERHAMPTLRNTPLDRIDRGDGPAGPHPDMDDPSRDSAAGAATDADGLPLGNGARLHEDQPGGRSHRRRVAPDAEGESTPQSVALSGSRGGARNRRIVPSLGVCQVVLPVSGAHGGPLR